MSSEKFYSLAGSVPALATPVTSSGKFDSAGLEKLVNHVIDGGVGGFNVLGTSGEFALVPPETRAEVIRTAVAANRGRVPLIVACGRPSVEETRREIDQAADLGADGVLCTPSYYYPLNGEETRRYFNALAESASIPIMYYHIPQMTKVAIGADVIGQLWSDGAIKGIKDSSGMAPFLARVISNTASDPSFRATVGGAFYLVGSLQMGAVATTGLLGTVFPGFEIAVIEAVAAGNLAEAREAQARLHVFQDWLFRPGLNQIAAAKAALEVLGICGREMWPPMRSLEDGEIDFLRTGLREKLSTVRPAAA